MEIDKAGIEAAIVRQVADEFIGDEELISRVRTATNERVDRFFREAAEAQIQATVEAAIRDGFDREYCAVTSWGERQGAPTTIRKQLERVIAGYWNETVDKSGKPSSGYSDKLTRAEWLMSKMCAADFKGNLEQHVVNIGSVLKDKLRAELHDTVNKLLSQVFHVKSIEDQAIEKRPRA